MHMSSASAPGQSRASPKSHATPIVFVVDDDVSVRESLELLIRCAGWQPETFMWHRNSLPAHESLFRTAWYLTLLFWASMASSCRSASPPRTGGHGLSGLRSAE